MAAQFFGKYRGTVTDNRDPLNRGRVEVSVPEVLGTTAMWATPCVSYAGKGVGLLTPPPKGTNVWVEFEAGSPERPIWVGCFWGEAEYPVRVPAGGVALRLGEITLVTVDPRPAGPSPLPSAPSGTDATELTVTADGMVISTGGRPVLTLNEDTVTIDLRSLRLALSASPGTVTLSSRDSSVTVSADGVKAESGTGKLSLAAGEALLSAGTGSVKATAASVELANGMAKVAVTPAMVSVNNGALEVS